MWWVDRTKLAASDSNYLRLEYVPIVARVMTLAIVWIKSDNRDTITVRVNVTSSPIKIIESPPTINDVLLESSDTPESPVFADLVSKLGRDPVKIYEYVRNNVFFDTYWGVLRGGLRTYYDGYGNSLDQSSLLISLLRTAGFPARYAFGVVKIPLTTLAETLGLRSTPSTIADAVQIYKLAGLLHYADRDYAMIYHVWVRAFINGTWIDLDPSLKKIVVKTNSPISGLASPPSPSVLTGWEDVFGEYVKPLASLPVIDIVTGNWIVNEEGIRGPPGEYVLLGLYSKMPDEYRGFITFYYPRWSVTRYDFAAGNYSFTLPTSALGTYRLTARFIPASKEVADYIASRPQGLSGVNIDDRRVWLRPQFLLNGMVLSIGDPAPPGHYLPIKVKFRVTLPFQPSFTGWGDESLMGYAAFVPDFMKTRTYGEIGIEGSRGLVLSMISPELTKGMDKDEIVGRILYLQTRRYQIERWHQIERIWDYRWIVQVFPLNIHKAELYQLINSQGKLVYGPPMFSAGIGWNSIAYYWVIDPVWGILTRTKPGQEVSLSELNPKTIPSYLPGSFYEGEVIGAIHGTIPYSTVHTFMYAASKGIRILHVNRNNVTSLPASIPGWIREGVARIAEEWKDVEFNAFMPEYPVEPDVLSIFISDDPAAKPPKIDLAGKMYGVLTVMPLSQYHAAVGGLIYNLGRGVEMGGGALSSTEQNSYTTRTEVSDSGVYYSQTSSVRDVSASESLIDNYVSKSGTDEGERLNTLKTEMEDLKNQLEKMDPNDPSYKDLLAKYLELAEQYRDELESLSSELYKLSFQADLLFKLIEGKIPIFIKPDGTLMETGELARYLAGMGVDKETRLQIILNQREAIQKAHTLGYIEIPYKINGDNVVMRLNYQYKLEELTSTGMKFVGWYSTKEQAESALALALESPYTASAKISFTVNSIEIIPQDPIKLSYKVTDGVLGPQIKEVPINQITLTSDQLGGSFALDPIIDLYSQVKSLSSTTLNDWKYSKANLPGGYEAQPLYEFWNLNDTQVQKITAELQQGKLPSDPPFVEAWIENAVGEYAGYNPEAGHGFGLNLLTYSGVGSKPKNLAIYGVWPGLYYLNIVGTKEDGVDGFLTVTYKVGAFPGDTVKIPVKVGYGELIKIPILVDKYQRLTVLEPKPGLRIKTDNSFFKGVVGDKLYISGKVLDQFGRQGVGNAKVQATISSPSGSVYTLEYSAGSDADGSFRLSFSPSEAGIYYATITATAEGFHPSITTIPIVVHGTVEIVNDINAPPHLLKGYLMVENGSKWIEIPIGEKIGLPAGRYIISIEASGSEVWRFTPKIEPKLSLQLNSTHVFRVSEIFSASVLIKVDSGVGRVEGGGWHTIGEKVTISAIPPADGGYRFVGWEGDLKSTQNPLVIQVEKPMTIKAVWEPVQTETTTTTLTTYTTSEMTRETATTRTTQLATTEQAPVQDITAITVTVVAIAVIAAVVFLIVSRRRTRRFSPSSQPST